MTTLLNFLGQPSSGKTSLSALVFAKLKEIGAEVEYASEYVKSWAWESRKMTPFDQYYIFGKECHNQSILFNKVDIVISDSPVMLTAFYHYFYNKKNSLRVPCREFYETAENDFEVKPINFFLPRRKDYNPRGRFQTQEEADNISVMLKTWLNFEGYPYVELLCEDNERLNEVMKVLEKEGVI